MGSSYIGLLPSKVDGVVLPPNSHMTLAFMEETKWEETFEILETMVNSGILKHSNVNKQKFGGFARFVTPKNDALVALVDVSEMLAMVRLTLVTKLYGEGIAISRGIAWTPHITLEYVDHSVEVKAPPIIGTVEFGALRFKEKDSGRIKEWKFIE